MSRQLALAFAEDATARCGLCGCAIERDDDDACAEPAWVEDDICDACAERTWEEKRAAVGSILRAMAGLGDELPGGAS